MGNNPSMNEKGSDRLLGLLPDNQSLDDALESFTKQNGLNKVTFILCHANDYEGPLQKGLDLLGLTKYGLSSAAVCYGDYIIEYFPTSQVSIRKINQQKFFLAIELFNIRLLSMNKKVTNVVKKYDGRPFNQTFCNSFQFAFEILEAFGIEREDIQKCVSPAVYSFIESSSNGEQKFIFEPKKFPDKKFEFQTHQELENFEYQVKELNLEQDEKNLIKGFHRSYQLREIALGDRSITCGFGDLTAIANTSLAELLGKMKI